jgi:transcriptional regulator with XRE-family HTH domain
MPAAAPYTPENVVADLEMLGEAIRHQRKVLGVNAQTVAQSAGISRVTLHRIEKGEPAVTIGAYLNAAAAVGLHVYASRSNEQIDALHQDTIPVEIDLAAYPQLAKLAWQISSDTRLRPLEAWGIYERNWRHLDQAALTEQERRLIEALERAVGEKPRV